MKRKGRPRAVSDRGVRAIVKIASNSMLTSRQFAQQAGVSTHVQNVQRISQKAENIQRRIIKRKPPLTKKHISWRKNWKRVIFSDEKRFTFNGPEAIFILFS